MIGVTHLVYQAAGSPDVAGKSPGMCRACGRPGVGVRFEDWVRPTFTNHDKLWPGEIVCHACSFCFDEQSELLRQYTGKEKPQRMRNYSHFVVDGEWIPLGKGDKPRMRESLVRSPQVAVIAVSGQKHLVFRARLGWWQIEEQTVQPFPECLEILLSLVEGLYLGFNKREIESGDYALHRITRFGLAEWRALEVQIAPWRGSIQFELALFLAQKGKSDVVRANTEVVRATGHRMDDAWPERLRKSSGAAVAVYSQGIQRFGLEL